MELVERRTLADRIAAGSNGMEWGCFALPLMPSVERTIPERAWKEVEMAIEWIALRVLHIVCGTFWVGSDVFMTFLLIPRLRALGPDVERAVMGALMRHLPPVMTVAALVTAITGVWMTGSMQAWGVGGMLASGWGLAMLVGLAGTVAALGIGLGVLPPTAIGYDRLNRAVAERVPTAEESERLRQLAWRATVLTRINSVLLLIVVIAMAVARFV